jgi:hypothetical protein
MLPQDVIVGKIGVLPSQRREVRVCRRRHQVNELGWQKAVDLVMRAMITDKLKSYGSAKRENLPGVEHRQHKGLNNRPGCPNLRRHRPPS